jgi:hypothetical protein
MDGVSGTKRRSPSGETMSAAVLAMMSSCFILVGAGARLQATSVAPTAVASPRTATPEFARPAVIRFGAKLVEMQESLRGTCSTMTTRRIDPPFLPDVADRHYVQ